LTHGTAAGEVTASSAVLWARCDRPATVRARLVAESGEEQMLSARAEASRDLTARLVAEDLRPSTRYCCQIWCDAEGDGQAGDQQGAGQEDAAGRAGDGQLPIADRRPSAADCRPQTANCRPPAADCWPPTADCRLPAADCPLSFRTAPPPRAMAPLRFAWGGDLGGQNVCRDRDAGYAIFDRVAEVDAEFFVALGDMIYADDRCRPRGFYGNPQVPGPPAPAADVPGFWAHWKYNRTDAHFQRFLAQTPVVAVWDDHEILNDAGPHHDTVPMYPDRHLLPLSLQAMLDYAPMAPPAEAPARLYRRLRWGGHLELFVLDTRQYRDANHAPDDGARPKTMLGDAQRQWLVGAVTQSTATWKIVVSSVPLSIPTGAGARDGWADGGGPTGFEREAVAILRAFQQQRVANLLWITTDVHFAAAFRYRPFADDPSFVFHEVATGPLTSGVFPRDEYDRTLGAERLFFYGPLRAGAIAGAVEARRWFNFGVADIAADGRLEVRVVNGLGETVYTLRP
jgi:phosphodiesterase/alkaline phosphatase D-like protein